MEELEAGFGDLATELMGGEEAGAGEQQAENAMEQPAGEVQQPQSPEPKMIEEKKVEQPPQFDPNAINELISKQSQQIEQISKQLDTIANEKNFAQEEKSLTDEELMQQKVKDELGISEMEKKFQDQQALIQKQQEAMAKMQEMEAQKAREREFKSLEKEFGNIDRDVIQNKIEEIAKSNPQLAESLNSPEGVRMLLSQGVGVVNKQPDPITPSASNNSLGIDDSIGRVTSGKGTEEDIGALLESYVS